MFIFLRLEMTKFNMGDKYWTFYTRAEIFGEVYWPFIELIELEVYHPYQLHEVEQVYFLKTKSDAVDAITKHLESMKS